MPEEPVSKTRRKREIEELRSLGEALARLAPGQLAAIELPEPLAAALREARRISGREAKRRQLQYLGKLMRQIDPAPIRAALAAIEGRSEAARARQRRLERWRKRLLADDAALTEFARQHAGADLQALRALIRNARKELAEERAPRAQRALLRRLADCAG